MFTTERGWLSCTWSDHESHRYQDEWWNGCDLARQVAYCGGLDQYVRTLGDRMVRLGPYQWILNEDRWHVELRPTYQIVREEDGLYIKDNMGADRRPTMKHTFARLTTEQLTSWLGSYLRLAPYTTHYRYRSVTADDLDPMTSLEGCTLDGEGAVVTSLRLEDCLVTSQPECQMVVVKLSSRDILAYPSRLVASHVIHWREAETWDDSLSLYHTLPIHLTAPVVYLSAALSIIDHMTIHAQIIDFDSYCGEVRPDTIPATWHAEVVVFSGHVYSWDGTAWQRDQPLRTDYRLVGYDVQYEWEPRYTVCLSHREPCPEDHQILIDEPNVFLTMRPSRAKSARMVDV